MDIRICETSPGGTVNVQGKDFGRTFGRGAEVNFNEPVTKNSKLTWGEAIGDRFAHLFVKPTATKSSGKGMSPLPKITTTKEEAE